MLIIINYSTLDLKYCLMFGSESYRQWYSRLSVLLFTTIHSLCIISPCWKHFGREHRIRDFDLRERRAFYALSSIKRLQKA